MIKNVIHQGVFRFMCALVLVSAAATTTFGSRTNSLLLPAPALAASGCQLNSAGGAIQHVIYIQFDNVHLTRDRASVPSDLELMPHLLNFVRSNGTMLSNNHTPLIAHTATDILTSLTGTYGDRMGVPISNSYRYFNPNGTTNPGVSFAYWTDPLFDPTGHPTDFTPEMIAPGGKIAPAPWVPYTRAGCDVGAIATANTVLENSTYDIPTVFGAGSPENAQLKANPDQAFADYVGIGVHCAQGSTLCAGAHGGRPDLLPDEAGGYTGFMGLFGHKYVAPQISPGGPVTDLDGSVIKDSTGHIGFPGFDGMSASVSLGYAAAMLEHGIPVTYSYISDAHDNHAGSGSYGPGEAGYVAALKSYDAAFGKFFDRLAADGINQSNSLFVITSDEGDHFAGGIGSPANCDGVTVPCTYAQKGEINGNLAGLLATQRGNTTPFSVHSDSAPNFYLQGNPARNAPITRTFERDVSQLTANNPYTGGTETFTRFMADPVEMTALHMVNADPARTPTFTMFADPNYFLFAGSPDCAKPCITLGPAFAWNHGTVSPDINTTWLGMVGPGVLNLSEDPNTWADHSDIRPTIMALLGLKDDYAHDGRVLIEDLAPGALAQTLAAHRETLLELAATYKQLQAPVGAFGLSTLGISTVALESNSFGDWIYNDLEARLLGFTAQRNSIAGNMQALLEGAAFGNQPISERQARGLIDRGQQLLMEVNSLENSQQP